MPLLALDKISLAFGHLRLLDGATAQFEAGERMCVLGRNGSGKSTLLRILSGEQAPDAGSVWGWLLSYYLMLRSFFLILNPSPMGKGVSSPFGRRLGCIR